MISNVRTSLLIVGITLFSAWITQQVEWVYGGPHVAGGVFPATVILPAIPVGLLVLLLVLRRWLDAGERAVIYAALVVGVTIAGSGLMHRFLPGLMTGFYGGYADPKGPYYALLKYIPAWLVPTAVPDSPLAVAAFEGGVDVPWAAWAVPFLGWSIFFVALFLTSLSLVWILKDRWIVTERLGFPLLDLPIALLEGRVNDQALFKNRGFLWGMLIPITLFGLNGLHHFYPALDPVKTGMNLGNFLLEESWKAMADPESPFFFKFSPFLMGIAYLAPVEVSFSTWVFFGVSRFQLLITEMVGLTEYRGNFLPNAGAVWLDWPAHFPFLMSQARGGLLMITLLSLWSARRAFAIKRPAVWAFLIGFAVLWGWTIALGLPPWIGLVGLLIFWTMALGFVRLRVDGGLPATSVYLLFGFFFVMVMGSGGSVFSGRTFVGFALMSVLAYTSIGMWPALQFEGLKLAEQFGVSSRRMAGFMCFGLIVGLGAGFGFALETIYEYGVFDLQEQGSAQVETRIGRYYQYLYVHGSTTETEPDWERVGVHVLGAGFTWFLIVMRQRFLRWPFHPLGFVFGIGFGWIVWGSTLLGWVCKWLTVRYGGAQTFRKVRPFFLGMIFGEIVMRLFWAAVALDQGEMGMGYEMPFMTEY